MTTTTGLRPGQPPSGAPPATRSRRPGWRNPRLLLGLVLVAGSVVLGARLMAAADDTVPVWSVARDLPAGAVVRPEDLRARSVRFPDAGTADGYLSATAPVPAGSTLAHALAQGELLPRGALARGAVADLVEVPVSVATDDLPATVRQGSRVDIWVTPRTATTSTQRPTATKVLADVVVVATPRSAQSLAPQSTRQLIVGVPAERADALGAALGSLADGRVVVAREG